MSSKSQATIIGSIQNFITSSSAFINLVDSGVKFLDLRPFTSNIQRIKSAYCIPADELIDRLHELCPRTQPISIIAMQNQAEIANVLITKGWSIKTFVVSNSINWQSPDLNKYIKSNEGSCFSTNDLLFEPSRFLKLSMASIINDFELNKSIKILDIGCGLGRDMAYLCLLDNRIKVAGIDMNLGCKEKVTTLFKNLKIEHQLINLFRMKFKFDQNTKKMIIKNYDYDQCSRLGSQEFTKPTDTELFADYDIVLMIRFYVPNILDFIDEKIVAKRTSKKEQGQKNKYLIISCFVDHPDYSYTKPKLSRRVLHKELRTRLESAGYAIIREEIQPIEDGRPVNCILAKRLV